MVLSRKLLTCDVSIFFTKFRSDTLVITANILKAKVNVEIVFPCINIVIIGNLGFKLMLTLWF